MTTAAELIAELQKLDPETEVFAWSGGDIGPETGPATVQPVWNYRPGSTGTKKAVAVKALYKVVIEARFP